MTAMLVVLSGSELDPPQLSGLASMTASLLTQGTRRRSAPEIAAAAEALGGSLESGAGWGQSLVAITVTTPRLGAALGLVAEVAREPTFAPAELERLRDQTLDALKVSYADPGDHGRPDRGPPGLRQRRLGPSGRAARRRRCRGSARPTSSPCTAPPSAPTARC